MVVVVVVVMVLLAPRSDPRVLFYSREDLLIQASSACRDLLYYLYLYNINLPLTFFSVPRETGVLAGTAVLAVVDITR